MESVDSVDSVDCYKQVEHKLVVDTSDRLLYNKFAADMDDMAKMADKKDFDNI
nr:hypothetical protein [Ectobacillus panaciterrae]